MQSYDVWKLDCPIEEKEELDYPESSEDFDFYNENSEPLSKEERKIWEEEKEWFDKHVRPHFRE